MDEQEQLKITVANNIAELRKKANLTQYELASKLNYSDKAISKWERGESLPDILVLKSIADLFAVKVDDLMKPNSDEIMASPNKKRLSVHLLVTIAAICIAWVVATAVYVCAKVFIVNWQTPWLCFVYALPVSAIILLVFSSIWWDSYMRCISISLIVWTTLFSIYMSLLSYNVWIIFVIGAPVQIFLLIWLWYRLEKKRVNASKNGKIE